MVKTKIIIITGTGGILGTGHFQRMLNLAVNLNSTNYFSASIQLKQNEHPLPEKFSDFFINTIPSDTDLIIRDMRDSSREEMTILKQSAPVLAIDDSGQGRESADYSLNLLPVPSADLKTSRPDMSLFLYGYNFAEGISALTKKKYYKRDIDITIYTGYNPSSELLSAIRKSIPASACSVLLKEGKTENFTGLILQSEIPYAEIISRSKIVITHFGLTMFEAEACGCRIAALNPTIYHGSLTDLIRNDFNIIYSSVYESFSADALKKVIQKKLENTTDLSISIPDILKKINSGTLNFIKYIETITNITPSNSADRENR